MCGKERQLFDCSVCDKKLASKTNLQEHLDRHENNPSVVCEYCGENFLTDPKEHIITWFVMKRRR